VAWIPRIAKWVLAIAAGYVGGWALSVLILFVFWLASVIAPVPYRNYLTILRQQASKLPPEPAQDFVQSLDRFAAATSPTGVPYWSIAGILYPLLGTLTVAITTPAPPLVLVGAFVANVGYLLLACAFLAGSFRAFGLQSRRATFFAAIAAFAVGFITTNIGFGALAHGIGFLAGFPDQTACQAAPVSDLVHRFPAVQGETQVGEVFG
jgi:hypothetical protein